MRLMEIMTTDVQTVRPEISADQALQQMHTHDIHHLVVMDGSRVLGVLSERDLGGPRGTALRRGRSVAELMTIQPLTASPTTTVRQAANLLRARSIGCLPVLDAGRLVGIVTLTDMLELLGRGVQLSPSVSSRYTPAHGSKWKPVRRLARPERP
ncbi:MAG TPA: CBS domain-containing protein, partial [Aggregicoccus sp.]|nr:CBS domain-containing protein [Aggregicoccus sp.]